MVPQRFRLGVRLSSRRLSLTLVAFLLLLGSLGIVARESEGLPPLTTVAGSPRLPGKFVWADLVTDDLAAARQFYGRLFGWRFQVLGNYTIGVNDERPLCGMFQRPRSADRPDAKPRWFGYLSVPDVERARSTVLKAGGRVLAAPQKMPKRGQQAVFADPEGAVFGVVKSSSGDAPDFLADSGDWIWIELLSRDAHKAGEFYSAVAGYDILENDTSERPGDYVFVSEGFARAAALTLPPERARVQPTWLLFVRIKNVTECLAQVSALGGKVLLAPSAQLFGGKLAIIADPGGAQVGVMEWHEETLDGGRRP